MRRLLKIGLFLLPIFIIPITVNKIHINQRDARELLFQSLAIIGLGIAINNRWLKYLLCWMVASWWFNYFLPPQSTVVLFNITFALLFFYFIKTFIKPDEIDGILKLVCLTALFQVLWLGIQALGWKLVFYPMNADGTKGDGVVGLIGWLGNTSILGAYLAMCLPLFRVYFKWFIVFVLLGLIVSRCAGAFVAGVSGLICFEFISAMQKKNIKKLTYLSLSCIVAVILFFSFIDRFGVMERFDLWKKLIVQTMNIRCLIGQGMGKFQNLRVVYKTAGYWDNPHNEYLQVYFELGLIGLVLLGGYLVSLFKRVLRFLSDTRVKVLLSGIVVLLVDSLGMFPMQIAPTAFLGITYFALLELILCQKQRNILLGN